MPGRNQGNNKKVEKAKDFKGTMLKLLKTYLKPYGIQLIIILIFAIGSTIFSIVGPKILGNATTEIFNGIVSKITGGDGINFEKIANIIITLVTLYVISMALSAIQGFMMTNIAQKITYTIRNDITKKISRLPMGYFDKKNNGEVLSIITNDTDTLSENLNQSVIQIITSACTVVGILIMMLTISWEMTVASILILPISIISVAMIVKKSQIYFNGQQEHLGHVNGQVEEIYGGHTIVKAFNGEEKAFEAFKAENEELRRTAWKSRFLSGLMHPIINFIGNIGYVAISILGGYFAINGRITVGNI